VSRRLLLALLLAVPLLLLARRARVTSDVIALLPPDAGSAEAVRVVRRFGTADALLFEVDGTGSDAATLDATARELAKDLAALPEVERVQGGTTLEQANAVRKVVDPHAAALIPAPLLAKRTSPAGVRQALSAWLAELAGPAGSVAAHRLPTDPLRLEELALDQLAKGVPGKVQHRLGPLRSPDGQRALVIATTSLDPTDVAPGDPFVKHLDAIAARQALPVAWFSGRRLGAATADAVRHDVRRAVGIGAVALVLVLLVGFRRVAPLLGAAVPLGFAALAAIAAAGALSPLHGLLVAFVSTLAGLGVDYWIHLYLAASATHAADPEAGRAAAAARALAEIRAPLALSAGTTALAFAVLVLSDVPMVRDLGALGFAATAGAWLGTVLLGPLAFALVGPGRALGERPTTPWPRAAAVVLLGTVALGLCGLGGHVDTDPSHLIATPPAVHRLQEHFEQVWGLTAPRGMAVVTGSNAGGVRDRAARLEQAIDDLGFARALGPGGVLPGLGTQAAREAALPGKYTLQHRIDDTAAALGLAPFPGAAARYHAQAAAVLPIAAWDATPIHERLGRTLVHDDRGWAGLVSVPLAGPSVVPLLADTVRATDPDAHWIVPTDLADQSLQQTVDALGESVPWIALGVFLLLLVRLRSARTALLALAPAAAGTAAAAGAMDLAGLSWNVVSLSGLVLLLGLSVDYGVFTVEASTPARASTTRRAILLGALTTMAGFGALAFATSPALAGLGVAVTAGLAFAAAVPLVVLPALDTPPVGLFGAVRRWLPRLAFATLIGFHLDVLLVALLAFRPPDAPEVPPPGPVEVHGGEKRVGPDRLVRSHGMRVLYTEGGPYESGLAYGALTPDLRHRLETELFASFQRIVPNPAARWLITRGSLVVGHHLDRSILPEYLLQLRGVVDSGTDPYWFKGPAYTRRVYYHALHDLGQALVDTPLLAACTGFMAGGDATTNGHWLLGRDFDFDGGVTFDRDKLVWIDRPEHGLPFLTVGFAGMIGAVTGVNEAGIAIAINAGGSDAPIRPGTPMTLILREILQHATSIDDAEKVLRERTGFVSENVMVVDGHHGQAALFEVTPRTVVRSDVPEWLAVSNHFRSPELVDDPVNQWRMHALTTVPRLKRMEELVGRNVGRLDLPVAARILADRRGVGDTPLPRGDRQVLNADIATHSAIIDATTRTVWVSRFPNISAGYVAIRLDDALDGNLDTTEVVPPEPDADKAIAIHQGRALLRAARRLSPREALPKCEEALRLMPDHPEAEFELGRTLWALGREDEARPLLDQALATPPEYARQADAIRKLLGAK